MIPTAGEMIGGTITNREREVQPLGILLRQLLQQRGLVPVRQPFQADSNVPSIQTALPQPRNQRTNSTEEATAFSQRRRFARA